MADRHLLNSALLKLDEGRQEAVHASEEWHSARIVSVHDLEWAASVLHPVMRHHSPEPVSYLALEVLKERILAIGADAHDELIVGYVFHEEVKILGGCLQIGVNVANVWRLAVSMPAFIAALSPLFLANEIKKNPS